MDRTNDKGTEHSACSKERKGTPFQRIVIACPDNHIIVVKRFISGEVKVEGGRLLAVENKGGH